MLKLCTSTEDNIDNVSTLKNLRLDQQKALKMVYNSMQLIRDLRTCIQYVFSDKDESCDQKQSMLNHSAS